MIQICNSLSDCKELPKTAVALGLFDGVHLGHQAVIRKAVETEFTPAVFTFHFDAPVLVTKKGFSRLLSSKLKHSVMESLGIRYLLEPKFSEIMSMEPEEFFCEILLKRMNAGAVFCGEDFRFGKGAKGNAAILRELCEKAGIRFETVDPVLLDGAPISSTRIREALQKGEIELANRLLGYPYMTTGEVVHGRHLGHKLGFPTINQPFAEDDLIPRFGVYGTIAEIDGKRYIGATDIGVKPSVGDGYAPAAETYLLDFSGDLYGREITLSYHLFIRPEKKFGSLEELTETVLGNAAEAKEKLCPLL